MLKILPKIPREKHWQALNLIPEESTMTPQEFMQYWAVDYTQLALITNQSIHQVRKWFSRGDKPSYEAKRRLAIVHNMWIKINQS